MESASGTSISVTAQFTCEHHATDVAHARQYVGLDDMRRYIDSLARQVHHGAGDHATSEAI
jgi:hypothetical protein